MSTHSQTTAVVTPLDAPTSETSGPIDQLQNLNQFITAELNPVGYRGRTRQGLLNALNGCFVIESSKPGDEALELVWLDESCGNNAHVVKLEGGALDKFLSLMQAQSAHFDPHAKTGVVADSNHCA